MTKQETAAHVRLVTSNQISSGISESFRIPIGSDWGAQAIIKGGYDGYF
jgi:hypothetical protein